MAVMGIFVGGKGTRMGGVSKALLRAPGGAETLVERLVRVGREARLEVVIVGEGDVGPRLSALTRLHDQPSEIGPLGGFSALLHHSLSRDAQAIAVGCDMPYVSAALLRKLAEDSRATAVLCPRAADGGKWQTLFARYAPLTCGLALDHCLALGKRSLQALLEQVIVTELVLSEAEHAELRDWDTPEDVQR